MKKLIALLLVLVMAVAMIACETTEPAPAAEPAAEEPAVEAAAAEEPAFKLLEEGKLLVALSPDFSPMEFIDTSKDGQDQYVGFDVSLSKFIAEQLGVELEIRPMAFDACQTAVQMNAVDMSISGYSWTEARAENFFLSDYYYAGENETKQTVIVPAEKADTYTCAEDFAGLKVGAQAASLQENLCNEQLTGSEIQLFKDINDAVLAMQTGKLDAVAVAEGNAKAIIANNDSCGLSGFFFTIDAAAENNVILLNKNAEALGAKVNELLAIAYEEGYYPIWYAEAKETAGIETAAQISYDEQGQIVG